MMVALATMASGQDKPQLFATWGNEIFLFRRQFQKDTHPELENRSGVDSPYAQSSNTIDSDEHDVQTLFPKVDTVQEAMAEYGITEPLLPTWLPKEFQNQKPRITVYYDSIQNTADFLVDYDVGTDKQPKEFHAYAYLIGHESEFPKEGEKSTYRAGGLTYTITETDEGVEAAAQTSGRKIFFTGNVSVSEMKKIIDSVYANK